MDRSTIAAIATPVGSAGIGIIRISGPDALSIGSSIFRRSRSASDPLNAAGRHMPPPNESHRLVHGHVLDPESGRVLDEVLLATMAAPHSYTREDVVEINSHSGLVVLKNILELVLSKGARLAEPGEFTKRAFINGRIDLTQAEAVMDVVNARSDKALEIATAHLKGEFRARVESLRDFLVDLHAQMEAAIDFPEDVGEIFEPAAVAADLQRKVLKPLEDLVRHYLQAHVLRDGLVLAVAGRPNVGKSSLMNRLIKKERVIVSAVPGTTRDFVEESVNIQGIPIIVADTAGLHETQDPVEVIGIQKTREYIGGADLVLFVVDASCDPTKEDYFIYDTLNGKNVILVLNKSDLVAEDTSCKKPVSWNKLPCVSVSALYGHNLEALKNLIVSVCLGDFKLEGRNTIVPNLRHKLALEQCVAAIQSVIGGLKENLPAELIAIDLSEAIDRLGEITGLSVKKDVLDLIFSRFCIGK